MKFWDVEVDLEQGEEVIIDSAEQKGIVEAINLDSEDNSVYYLIKFEYGSVHTIDAGYESDCIWLKRDDIRKIKKKEQNFAAWNIEKANLFNDTISKKIV